MRYLIFCKHRDVQYWYDKSHSLSRGRSKTGHPPLSNPYLACKVSLASFGVRLYTLPSIKTRDTDVLLIWELHYLWPSGTHHFLLFHVIRTRGWMSILNLRSVWNVSTINKNLRKWNLNSQKLKHSCSESRHLRRSPRVFGAARTSSARSWP